MVTQIPDPQDVAALRSLVDGFIQERLQLKLDKLKDDDAEAASKRLDLQQAHVREVWLANAASRVSWIQVASHILKGIHPSARGTSLYVNTFTSNDPHLLGTHTLQGHQIDDVTGDAAALDVFKFLKLQHQGQSLLVRLTQQDSATLIALSEDADQATQWAEDFAGIVKGKSSAASHTLAKQLYFPLTDGAYHLLAPLFPTALVHGIHLRLQEDRFSEAAKAARTAKRAQQAHPHGYCDYPNMVVRKMGGSKAPQLVHCRVGSSEIHRVAARRPEGVHCRVGSSEMDGAEGCRAGPVHCRVGSSENKSTDPEAAARVHCRVGSSEIDDEEYKQQVIVHCRVGSSEKHGADFHL